jgi:16S rRNA (guanine966-N2)-methyltransferase
MTLRIVAGKFKGRLLKAPKVGSTRPTQGMLREAVFNICQAEVPGARFLDLFAGSGAMGFEAISRGALSATLIEQNRQAASTIEENIALLAVQTSVTLLKMDSKKAIAFLTKHSAQFDLIYIDPPYDTPIHLDPLLPLLSPHAIVFVEERHTPKKPHTPPTSPYLELIDTRKFGTALLTTFHKKETK